MSAALDHDPRPPAVRFEPLPERVDLLGLVLTCAGLGALAGSAYGALRGADAEASARFVRRGSLFDASICPCRVRGRVNAAGARLKP